MHDRRSFKKSAVVVAHNNDDVTADLMWLMMFTRTRCRVSADLDFSGYQTTGSQCATTFATSHSSCTTERVIGKLDGHPRQGVIPRRSESRRLSNHGEYVTLSVRSPCRTIRRSLALRSTISTTSAPSSRQREAWSHSCHVYKEYDPTISSLPDSTVDRWHAIGISPIAAASACFLGKIPSNRSEVDAITLFLQVLELTKNQEELNQGAKKFLDRCTTYMKTFVQLASRNNHKVLGFCTIECINGLGNMWEWEYIKDFHVPHPIRNDGAFTVSMLSDHLREFKLRPYGGDLRGVSQSVPAENTWLSATRKKDGVLNPSDPD